MIKLLKEAYIKLRKKKEKVSIWNVLRYYNIPYWKFIFFYFNLMSKGFLLFFYSYFRYFMLIIWRRTLLIWASILAYFNITEEMINNFVRKSINIINYFLNQLELFKQILIGIIIIISLYYIFKIIKKVYTFLFKYTDILYFNDKIKNFYTNNIVNFIERNKQKRNIKTKEDFDLNEIKKIENKYKKHERIS